MANVHVNLLFEANTQNAINNINQLGQLLNQISSKTTIGVESGSLNQAAQAARELQVHLGNAVNVNTGKLDLTKLNSSLKQSNQSLSQLSGQLVAAGTTGQQAFAKLASSIASAQAPAFAFGNTLRSMAKTMGTAMMWSVAYGAIDAVTQAIKGAIDYAKDLNNALTDIGIVSEMSEQQLANFAKTASKAAKDLKTTTTAYAEAALIFYQQGLEGKAVEERTNAVIKMMHVTGQAAKTVSDQMTAVWNNFEDGTRSLEYYIDVLTALGAATASSTDEITQGLEKFAAIANTVGLSYEYAATALATVTAQTRQSADVVGTAFKTLFARIQDLELGETLEDGVTLGSYSQALAKIGVSALDANGNLREMDDILNDMGAKWDYLTEAQQTATAQSVAGVRQYTQLIALMDNWDTFKINLEVAEDAEGTLDKQFDVWEKSAEAASERVKESWNEIYSSLLDDDTVIGFSNALADVMGTFASVIDSIGGLGPILLTLAAIFSNKLIPLVASFGSHLIYNFKVATGAAQKETAVMRASFQSEMQAMIASGTLEPAMAKQMALTDELMKKKIKAESITKNLVGAQKEEYEMRLKLYESMNQEAQKLLELSAAKEKEVIESKKSLTFNNSEFRGAVAGFNAKKDIDLRGVKDEDVKTEEKYRRNLVAQNQKTHDRAEQSIGISKSTYYQDPKHGTKKEQARNERFRTQLAKDLGGEKLSDGQLMVGTSVESLEKVTKAQMEYNQIAEKTKNISQEVANAAQVTMSVESQQIMSKQEVKTAVENYGNAELNLANAQAQLDAVMQNSNSTDQQKKAAQEAVQTATEKLAAETKNLEVVTKGLSTEEKIQIGTITSSQKTLAQAEASYKKLGRQLGMTDKEVEDLSKDFTALRNGTDTNGQSLTRIQNAFSSLNGIADMTSEEMAELSTIMTQSLSGSIDSKKLEAFITKLKESGHYSEQLEAALRGVGQAGDSLDKVSTKGASAQAVLGGLGRAAGSLQMAFSSITMLTRAFTDPDMSGMERMTTILMGISMILPMIAGGIGLVTTLTSINTAATKIATNEKGRATKASIAEAVAKMVESGAISANTAAIWANTAALLCNPIFLIVAVILAVIAALVILIATISNGVNKAIAENEKQQIENNKVTLESIDANQELVKSLEDLTAKYKELKASGQSTYDTMEDLKKQIPELIQNYSQLETQLGMDLGIERLEAAYQAFLNTGEIDQFEAEVLRVKTIVADQEIKTAQQNAELYRRQALRDATDGSNDGTIVDNNYEVAIGGVGTMSGFNIVDKEGKTKRAADEEHAASLILEDIMGDKWDGSKISFDTSSATSLLEGYEGMKAAYAEMSKQMTSEQLARSDTARELKREIDEMAPAIEGLSEAQVIAFENQKTKFVEGGEDKAFFEKQDIKSLDDYREKRAQIIADLQKQYDITEAQAENFLSSSEYFKNYEISLDLFADDGRIAEDLKNNANLSLQEVQNWYSSLPEEDKNLFMSIDFSQMGSLDEAKEKLEEIRKQAQEQAILSEAQALDYDEATFETYTDLLVDTNEHLKENSITSKQIALNNLKLNKGLTTLADSWEDINEVLSYNKRGTIEYAEAIGQIKGAMEEAFGFVPSTDFIEGHLEEIQKLAEGDIDSLQDLQDELAEDYVANMTISTSINEGQGFSVEEVQNELYNFLDSIDTSLEIGEGTTISDDYLNTLQTMLDNGQITADQLQGLMRAKGFELEITGWKEVTGPETITSQTSYTIDPNTGKRIPGETKVWGIKETMQVPIINGDDTGIVSGTASKASLRKSSSANAINQSTINKNKDSGGSGREKKKYEDEIERYHEINAELEDLERQLDAIAEAKDRAFGPDKLAYMDQEIAKQRELADAQKRYLSEIEANFKSDASYMLGYGAILDEEGRITNYDELMQSKIDAYNSGEMSEEAYEQFVEDLGQYEETLGLLKDEQQEFINLQNTIIDLGLEKVQYEVEFKVSIEEDSLTLIEFMMDNLTDSVADAADTIGYFGQQADSAFKNMDTYAKAVRDVFSVEDANGEAQFSEEQINALLSNDPEAIAAALEGETLTEAQIEALREYRDAMIDEYKNAQEASIGIIETLGSAFEDAQKPFADAAAEMEHLTSMTQAYVDVIELVGAERLGVDKKLLTAAAKTQTALAQQQLTNSKNQLEQSKQMLADYRVAYEQALASGDAKVIQAAKEQLESMEATVKENEQAMLSDLSAALEAAASEFAKAMEEIASSFEDAMTGAYGSFAALEASFEQQKALADRYLDDYQKIYELSKLNRDIVNSIDDNDSIRAKERLRDIQEEINKLQESNVEMTQYEVDELRAKYELRLAEIALEEAQNAKSQVRMARDSEGNWSYVYTADEEAVGTAEQNYEDKLYAYQELAQNRTDELLEQMISIPREFSEAIQEIYQDQTLNDEERRLRIKETEEYYQEMYSFVVQQLRVVNADAAELYTLDWKRYSEMTGYKISLDSNWIDSFEETVVAQLTGYSTLAEAEQGFLTSSQLMLISLSGAYQTYQTTTKGILDTALDDLAGFLGDESTEGSLAYYLEQAKEKAKEVTDQAAAIGTAHAEAFENATKAAKEKLGEYQTQMTKWKEENGLLIESINKVISTYANTKSAQDGIKGIENALDGLEGAARAVESAANAAAKALRNLYNTQPEDKSITIKGFTGDPAVNDLTSGSYTITSASAKTGGNGELSYVKGKTSITVTTADGKTQNIWVTESTINALQSAGILNITTSKGTVNKPAPVEQGNGQAKAGDKVTFNFSRASTDGTRVGMFAGSPDGIVGNGFKSKDELAGSFTIRGDPWKATGGPLKGTTFVQLKELTYKSAWDRTTQYYNVPLDYLQGYDTGGYTGSWDSSGRIAMLHQKELVLNAEDTVNFLDAVNIVREIAQAIDLSAVAQAMQMGNLQAAQATSTAQTLEQQVSIHAEFPNATNHSEIEEAFRNLTLTASQFANRKN